MLGSRDLKVSLSVHHFWWNTVSTTTGWIAMNFSADIHGPIEDESYYLRWEIWVLLFFRHKRHHLTHTVMYSVEEELRAISAWISSLKNKTSSHFLVFWMTQIIRQISSSQIKRRKECSRDSCEKDMEQCILVHVGQQSSASRRTHPSQSIQHTFTSLKQCHMNRSCSGPLTHPLDVSDGRHRAGIFEVVSQHGHQVVGGACDPLQLHVGLHQVGQRLCTLHPLFKQMLFTAHPHKARQGLGEIQDIK